MRIALLFIACFFLISPVVPVLAREEGIAAIVNDGAISMSDMKDRLRLAMVSAGLPDSPEIRNRLTPQVMNSLIEEELMLQESQRLDISVAEKEIDEGFAQLARQNKMNSEEFRAVLSRGGINPATMRRQIRSQIAWSKAIQKKIRPQIAVTEADVDEYLARLNMDKGKTEFLVAEIFLPVDAAGQESETLRLASRLAGEMRAGKAPFFKVAQQFSKAPGAAQGGDRGWLREGQISAEFENALKSMKPNSISEPVRSEAGYHIFLLRDSRSISAESLPGRDKATTVIGLQRMERMQRRYLMDLKSAAFIENRVKS